MWALVLASLLPLGFQDEVEGLIEKLGSERIDERDEAAARLKKLGKKALHALRQVAGERQIVFEDGRVSLRLRENATASWLRWWWQR